MIVSLAGLEYRQTIVLIYKLWRFYLCELQ